MFRGIYLYEDYEVIADVMSQTSTWATKLRHESDQVREGTPSRHFQKPESEEVPILSA